MASGTLGADEQQQQQQQEQPPKEKHRWSENSKVYTRKIHKANKNPTTTNNNNHPNSTATTALENQPNENNNNNNTVDNNTARSDHNHAINGTSANNNNNDDDDGNNGSAPQTHSPEKVPTEEANSSQPHHNSSRVETATASEDSSSLNRPEAPVPNGHDENLVNGLVVTVRPVVTVVDDRVNISVSAASSKEEVRELKRKLEDELDQVRKMAKRVEAKEVQLGGFSAGGAVGGATSPVVGSFQFPVNGGARVIPEMGSVGFNDSRPFSRQLSVSVMDNNHHGVGEIIMEKEKRTPKANQLYRNSEFLLGKEKLPPADTNRKSKSNGGGRKHHGGNREFDSGFGFDKKIFKRCSELIHKLMKHKHAWVFNQPVDVKGLGLHDYFDIIKHPMDLGTVKTRLTKNWYKTPREFAEDVRLTFHNAMTYNPEGQDVHIMAVELLNMFEKKWPEIEAEYDRKLRYEMFRDLVPTPNSRKTYAPAHTPTPFMPLPPPPLLHHPPPFQTLERSHSMGGSKPAYSVGRTPAPKKPKAKDPHKRDMTFEEKQRLSVNLQSLPSEKLDAIVQIIKKRNSALSQRDDEIEVDIDSVDAETLWELDRFVTNYKKSLSKIKRRAELAQARAAAAAQAAQETVPAPANIEAPKETRADEGNVASSPQVENQNHGIQNGRSPSDSSSSSSSSSDSGSSSSDSDSDSSSGDESDGGH